MGANCSGTIAKIQAAAIILVNISAQRKALYRKPLTLHKNTFDLLWLEVKRSFYQQKKKCFVPQEVRPSVHFRSLHVRL